MRTGAEQTSHVAWRGTIWDKFAAKRSKIALMVCILEQPSRRSPTAVVSSHDCDSTAQKSQQAVIAVLDCEPAVPAPRLVWKSSELLPGRMLGGPVGVCSDLMVG